jgi:hypothetical protein
MASLIALICEAHPERDAEGPLITLVDGLWAYCPARDVERGEHRWRAIEPTTVETLRARAMSAARLQPLLRPRTP